MVNCRQDDASCLAYGLSTSPGETWVAGWGIDDAALGPRTPCHHATNQSVAHMRNGRKLLNSNKKETIVRHMGPF